MVLPPITVLCYLPVCLRIQVFRFHRRNVTHIPRHVVLRRVEVTLTLLPLLVRLVTHVTYYVVLLGPCFDHEVINKQYNQ